MTAKFIPDACAMTAFIYGGQGTGKVQKALEDAYTGTVEVFMHKMDVLEAYNPKLPVSGEQ